MIPKWLNVDLKEMNFDGFNIERTEKIDEKTGARVISFITTTLDAQFNEKRATGPSYIYPHILILAKSFKYNNETHTLFNETKDLYSWYKSLVDSMDDDSSFLKEKVTELTAKAKSDEEKIKNIYY